MASGNGDLKRPARLELTAHLGEVGNRVRSAQRRTRRVVVLTAEPGPLDPRRGRSRRAPRSATDGIGGLAQGRDPDDLDPRRETGLRNRIDRDDDPANSPAGEGGGQRQDTRHADDIAAERQLPDHRQAARSGRDLLGPEEDPDRDGKVQRRAGLAQVRRCEVDRDPARRMAESGVPNSASNPLARFLKGGIGQADDREPRQSGRDVDLDPDDPAVETDKGGGQQRGEHTATLSGVAHRPVTDHSSAAHSPAPARRGAYLRSNAG